MTCAPATAFEPRPRPDLRERILRSGPESLAETDLVALVLGTGAGGEGALSVAARLLEATGGLAGLSRVSAHALALRRGIGQAKAARLVAALDLGRRTSAVLTEQRLEAMDSFDAVVAWARPRLALLEHEEVWLLSLDGRNGLKTATRIAQGGLHGTALLPADVLRPALRSGASAIIVIHNHPSGDPRPSEDDVRMTDALARACAVVGVPLLDHVVVARGGATSLRSEGFVP